MAYQYGVPINDFRLPMVAVILAATPKSAKDRIQMRKFIENDLPNLTFPSSVKRILAPYQIKLNFS